jgi:TPP-dependent pyruvate/acetoin dehydrogenase alpha subunit
MADQRKSYNAMKKRFEDDARKRVKPSADLVIDAFNTLQAAGLAPNLKGVTLPDDMDPQVVRNEIRMAAERMAASRSPTISGEETFRELSESSVDPDETENRVGPNEPGKRLRRMN